VSGSRRVPRALHPIAWWLWAAGLATVSIRTTNPLLLLLILAALAFVVANRRTEAPWARAFGYYLVVALSVVALRVLVRTVFAGALTPSEHILVTLPQLPVPSWYAGIRIGGPISLEATLSAAYDGLRLACLLCCVGAANALANPKRALRVLPGALYELGVAVIVAVSVAPQLIESFQRVRLARRLRADPARRLRALRPLVIPVVEDAFERSLRLAAAMDCRGYGRAGAASPGARRVTGAAMVAGMLSLCAGVYGMWDPTMAPALGLAALTVGSLLCVLALVLGSRRVMTTAYRPDPWALPEWAVSACGLGAAALMSSAYGVWGLNPALSPLRWPALPAMPVLAICLAALAGVVSPPPPPSRRRAARPAASPGRSRPDRVSETVA